ncbi:MAG TPA: hypothetical protein VFC67_24485 [Prolixibacteraceae bacterium]|nr:hypothetical protein [Prolixibacteraceae bacterium]
MSSTSDYNELLPQILSVPSDKALKPTMPVDVYLQEAEDLYTWCLDDLDALVGAGLDVALINDIPVRAGACREAQSLWVKNRKMRNHTSEEWKSCLLEATDLRSQLLHAFRYAFRAHDDLLAGIGEIAKSNSRSAIVQDLNDLSVLGNSNLDLLKAIRMDIALLETASLKSYQMGDMAGFINSARRRKSEANIIRNKAFTYLKQAMDNIRRCGKYVFWQNTDRMNGYTSNYWKHKNSLCRRSTAEEEVSK